MKISSEGIIFSIGATPVDNVLEIPELGGTAEKIEVTCLADKSKKYIRGIKDYGDLEFQFLFDNSVTGNYRTIKALEVSGADTEMSVKFPDGSAFTFSGTVMTTVNSAKVGDPITFTMSLALSTEIDVTDPTV